MAGDELTVRVRAEVEKAVRDLGMAENKVRGVAGAAGNLGSSAAAAQRPVGSLWSQMGKFAGAAGIATGVAALVSGIKNFAKESVEAFQRQEQAEARLRRVIETTGQAAGISFQQMTNYASSLQQVTTYGDEAIIEMQSMLATFKSIQGEGFERTTELALDMSSAFDQDLKSSALQLGKALEDPQTGLTALRRVGVSFTAEQENMIDSLVEGGRVADAQAVILDTLEGQVGGVARAMAETSAGSATQLKNTFGDLQEGIGGLISSALQPLQEHLNDVFGAMNNMVTLARTARPTAELFAEAMATGEDEDVIEAYDAISERIAIIQDQIERVNERTDLEKFLFGDTSDLEGQLWAHQQSLAAIQEQRDAIIERQEEERRAAEQAAAAAAEEEAANQRRREVVEELGALYDDLLERNATQSPLLAKRLELDELEEQYARIMELNDDILGNRSEYNDLFGFDNTVQVFSDSLSAAHYLTHEIARLKKEIEELETPTDFFIDQDDVNMANRYATAAGTAYGILGRIPRGANEAGEAVDYFIDQDDINMATRYATAVESLYGILGRFPRGAREAGEAVDYFIDQDDVNMANRYATAAGTAYGILGRIPRGANEAGDAVSDLDDAFEGLAEKTIAILASGVTNSIAAIGQAMVESSNAGDAFGEAMVRMASELTAQFATMAIGAGLRILVETGMAGLPLAIGLFALGGVSALASGRLAATGVDPDVSWAENALNTDPRDALQDDLDQARDEISDELEVLRDRLREEEEIRDEHIRSLERGFDQEYTVLEDMWKRNLITTQEFQSRLAGLNAGFDADVDAASATADATESEIEAQEELRRQNEEEQKALEAERRALQEAKDVKIATLADQALALKEELNGMNDWDRFFSGRDEEIVQQLDSLDARRQVVEKAVDLQSVRSAARGGMFDTSGPELLLVGDNPGGRERVMVEPLSSGGYSGGEIHIHIHNPIGIEDLEMRLSRARRILEKRGRLPAR